MSAPGPTDPARLAAQYEALRAQVLAGSAAVATPLGLGVLLRRGLASWLVVCGELVPAAPAPGPPSPAVGPSAVVVPIGLHAEAIRVLATMALAACQKGGP